MDTVYLAVISCIIVRRKPGNNFSLYISGSFFPNALYIVTDLIHLKDRGGAPVWYDAILYSSSLIGIAHGLRILVS